MFKKTTKNNKPTTTDTAGSSTSNEAQRPPKRRSKFARRAGLVTATVLLAGAAGYGGSAVHEMVEDGTVGYQAAQYDGNTQMTSEERDITAAVNKVSKSVVSIVTEVSSPQSYFGMQVGEGAGTGIIVSSNGYVLTNKHVIDGASNISVVASDGTRYDDVRVVGEDPLNDIAFLKIRDAQNLPVAEIGDSSSVRIAQEVIAIGNSLGQYQNTVTSGIISGKGRPVTAETEDGYESLTGLLQTDTAINPGNSGGPLINTSGQVIGINTAMAAEAQGIGFAIPIDATKGMLKGVLKNGKGERSFLGVNYISVTPDVAKEYDLPVDEGAYVYAEGNTNAVSSNSPADKAGIEKGDIITKVNDKVVGQTDVMSNLVAEYAPGETITFEILRDGKKRTVKVTLATYPS